MHQSRQYAAVAEQVAPVAEDAHVPPVTQTGPRKAHRVLASPVLSRPPLLTRDLTPFEKAFYLYQKRLNERLALPFTRYFYYKKDTPGDVEWKRKQKVRKTAAKDIGIYTGYGDEAWNDELLVGDKTSEPSNQIEALMRDAEGKDIVEAEPQGDAEAGGEAVSGDARQGEGVRKDVGISFDRPAPRETEADRKKDTKSLSRRLDRSLYLLIKNKDGRWRFPEDRVYGRENLHQVRQIARYKMKDQTTNNITGGRARPHPVRRPEHEYLARWQPPHWPLHLLLHQAKDGSYSTEPLGLDVHRGGSTGGTRREGLLP